MFTNRLFKVLQQFIASTDDLRPAMQGTAVDGKRFLTVDGHRMVTGEIDNPDAPDLDPAILRFDTKQAMNADFFIQPHEVIIDQPPSYHEVIPLNKPKDEDGNEGLGVRHQISFSVSNLLALLKTLKKLDCKVVDFFFLNSNSRAVAWSSEYAKDVENLKGLLMPLIPSDRLPEYPFTEDDLKRIETMVENIKKAQKGDPVPAE